MCTTMVARTLVRVDLLVPDSLPIPAWLTGTLLVVCMIIPGTYLAYFWILKNKLEAFLTHLIKGLSVTLLVNRNFPGFEEQLEQIPVMNSNIATKLVQPTLTIQRPVRYSQRIWRRILILRWEANNSNSSYRQLARLCRTSRKSATHAKEHCRRALTISFLKKLMENVPAFSALILIWPTRGSIDDHYTDVFMRISLYPLFYWNKASPSTIWAQ